MINLLDWDSRFFNLKIGQVSVDILAPDVYSNICQCAIEEDYDLIYIMENEIKTKSFLSEDSSSSALEFRYVDTKFTFLKEITEEQDFSDSNIHSYKEGDDERELYNLGLEAGLYSRFYTDKNFKKEDYIRFYSKWVENSILKIICNEIFIFKSEDTIIGFVTVQIKSEDAIIGLIAINENHRGLGIGKKLINKAAAFAFENGCKNLYVSTQGANKAAVDFYQSCQFKLLKQTNIYHLWKT